MIAVLILPLIPWTHIAKNLTQALPQSTFIQKVSNEISAPCGVNGVRQPPKRSSCNIGAEAMEEAPNTVWRQRLLPETESQKSGPNFNHKVHLLPRKLQIDYKNSPIQDGC